MKRMLRGAWCVAVLAGLTWPAAAVNTNFPTVFANLRTFASVNNSRPITLVPQANPVTDGTNLYWSAPLLVYPTNGVAVISNLVPNNYTVTMAGIGGSWTLPVPNTNGYLNAVWLSTNLLTFSWNGVGSVYVTNSYTVAVTNLYSTTNVFNITNTSGEGGNAAYATNAGNADYASLAGFVQSAQYAGGLAGAGITNALVVTASSNLVAANGFTFVGDGGGLTNLTGVGGAGSAATNVPYVTPQQFGAKGDAVTDDTGALQAWLSYASSNQFRAYLPPAPGGYYKLNGELFITNGIYLFGAGGSKQHNNQAYMTRSRIEQTARNTTALHVLNAVDTLHIDNIAITCGLANNFTNTTSTNQLVGNNFDVGCYGLYLDGGTADSDCSLIEQVIVTGFGIGCEVGGCAVTKFSCCSFGYNGIGLQFNGPTPNDLCVITCSIGANYSNNVVVIKVDNIGFFQCDFIANHSGCQSVCIGRSAGATFYGCRFEETSYTDQPALISKPDSIGDWGAASIMCVDTAFQCNSDDRYKVALTNCQRFSLVGAYFAASPKHILVHAPLDTVTRRIFAMPPRQYTNSSTGTLVSEWATPVDPQYPSRFIASGTLSNAMFAPGQHLAVSGLTTNYVFPGTETIMTVSSGLIMGITNHVWDADASNFLVKVGYPVTLANTTATALNTLVGSLKTSGVWDNVQVIYPFIGTAETNGQNLKSASHTIIWSGTFPTNDATGPNGSAAGSAYGDTQYVPVGTNASFFFSVKAFDATASTYDAMAGAYEGTKRTYFNQGTFSDATASWQVYIGNDSGTYLSSQSMTNPCSAMFVRSNSTLYSYTSSNPREPVWSGASVFTGVPSGNIWLFNRNSGTMWWDGKLQGVVMSSNVLSAAQFAAMHAAWTNFNAALGR